MSKFLGMSLEKPRTGRPLFKRLTVVGLSIYGAVSTLQGVGLLPQGAAESLTQVMSDFDAVTAAVTQFVKTAGVVVAAVGVYRHRV